MMFTGNFIKKCIFFLTVLFAGLVFDRASALDANASLENLIKDGLKSSIAIKTQDISLEQAEIRTMNAWTNLLPTVSLSAGKTISNYESVINDQKSNLNSSLNTAEISGSWNLWDNYSSIRNIKIAKLSEDIEQIKKRRDSESYILSLLDTYFGYLLLLRQREVFERLLVESKWTHEESLALVKAGARTQIEALDTEIQVLNTERDLLELNQNIRSTLRSLQVLLNKDADYLVPTMDLTELDPYFMRTFPKVLAELKNKPIGLIVEQSKDHQISKLGMETYFERLKQTELGYWPTTSLRVGHTVNLDNYVADVPSSGLRTALNSTTVSLNLSWQVWDWLSTQRSIKSSKLDYQVSALRFHEEVEISKAKVESYLESFEINRKSLEASQKALIKAQKQNEYSREMYKMGRINLLSMQQSISRLFDAEISYAARRKTMYILAAQILYYNGTSLAP